MFLGRAGAARTRATVFPAPTAESRLVGRAASMSTSRPNTLFLSRACTCEGKPRCAKPSAFHAPLVRDRSR